jgi:hypothetical protein
LEPFEGEQVGSSAMPYKRNPMRAERMTGLARFVIELEGNAAQTAAQQWLERTLDDSANRRLVIPEAFLVTDAVLVLATNVAAGLEVREATIAEHVAAAMPFLATERLLMRGVKAGGDRQQLHEVIRGHSLHGAPGDLLERLAGDPALAPMAAEEMIRWATPAMHFRRTAMRDVELRGQRIRAGDKVVTWYISANRDELVFEDPYRFDAGRWPNPQVAFGPQGASLHFCLGADLARMEVAILFRELLPRLRSIELAGSVERLRSNFHNGLKHMPVRVTAR